LAAGEVEVRVPLIPGITDTDANMQAIFDFLRSAGMTRLALLPLDPAAGGKYDWLGRRYEIDAGPLTPERPDALQETALQHGITATIG
jgi:pyruvate formate lyase activating enzyme